MSRLIRFGPYELDPEAHVLRKGGTPIRLQEQPWLVLCALVEKPGSVVTRDELQKRLWPEGTFVDFEQSLNKAVNKLREALSDSADKPRYIETLARQGYRFIAPVEVKQPATEPAPVVALRPTKRRPRRWWLYGLAAFLAIILITGLWPPPQPKTQVTALTPSDGRMKQAFLAVSGGRVFYTASDGTYQYLGGGPYSVPMAGGEPRREPAPCPEDSGRFIRNISYILQRLLLLCFSDGPHADLWLVGLDGSNPKWIGRYDLENQRVSISPDLKTLLFSRKEGLFVKPVEGGAERLVARVEWGEDPSLIYWHPSGTRIAFNRVVDGLVTLWEVRVDGTGMRPLLPDFKVQQGAAQWSPDGRRLYFTSGGDPYSGGDLYLQGPRGWLGWMRRPAPVRLTSGPTRFGIPYEDPADPLAVYAWGYFLQATSMKFNRKANAWEPFLGGLPADCLDYSPDGQWIAYVSFPSGELWKCRKDGSGRVLLEDGLFTYGPRWSPDGNRIAFAAHGRGSAGEARAFRIYTISANGGKPEPVPGVPGPAFDPTWSPDGKRLAFAPNDGEGSKEQQHVSIVNLETGAVQAVPGSDNLFSVRWSPDGNSLAALTSDKIWPFLYSFRTQKWTELRRGVLGFPHWSKDSRYVYGYAADQEDRAIRIEVAARKVEEIRKITEFNRTGVLSPGIFWTPDEEPVVLKDLSTQQIYRIDRDR